MSCIGGRAFARGALASAALIIVLLLAGDRAHAQPWPADRALCSVTFDSKFALTNVLGQARATFASMTGMSSAGALQACNTAVHQACWDFRHRCYGNYVNVDPVVYGHFHLAFESATLGGSSLCFVDPGDGYGAGFGRMVGSSCVAASWANEPRSLFSHDVSQAIKLWLEDAHTHAPTSFDIDTIFVTGSTAVQVWFMKSDGSWWYWPHLAAGYNWYFPYLRDALEVQISGASGEVGPISIANFAMID